MQTSEIVRRLLSRPVTKERALRMLHLLETPGQVHEVIEAINTDPAVEDLLRETLNPSVVQAHFAKRAR